MPLRREMNSSPRNMQAKRFRQALVASVERKQCARQREATLGDALEPRATEECVNVLREEAILGTAILPLPSVARGAAQNSHLSQRLTSLSTPQQA
mmetsp:Transcript_150472/g.262934  ORF Transcript_150472/g.262934 Transcript_150472/m.262934 type:complete len:96 (-) Transcript_150472:158-445(-)